MSCGETAKRNALLEKALQEGDDLLSPFRGLDVGDVIAQQLPALGMALLGVDARELAVDDVEALDRRQLVLETGEAEMGARRDERVDLRRS